MPLSESVNTGKGLISVGESPVGESLSTRLRDYQAAKVKAARVKANGVKSSLDIPRHKWAQEGHSLRQGRQGQT